MIWWYIDLHSVKVTNTLLVFTLNGIIPSLIYLMFFMIIGTNGNKSHSFNDIVMCKNVDTFVKFTDTCDLGFVIVPLH